MAELIRMPRLSDTMEEGVIVEWHKKEGDPIQVGDVLAEVETDKATMDLESYWDGVLLKILAPKGQSRPPQVKQAKRLRPLRSPVLQLRLPPKKKPRPQPAVKTEPASKPRPWHAKWQPNAASTCIR